MDAEIEVSLQEILFQSAPDSSQKLVVKLAGTRCNIDCTYCGEKEKDLEFDDYITADILKKTLETIDQRIDLLFHGGEPFLIGCTRFRFLLEVVRQHRDRINSVGVQTNGTLIDKKWISLLFVEFSDLDIQISISLDGTREMNKLRVGYNNKPTFDRVLRGFRLLHEAGIRAGLLSVISHHALDYASEYVSLLSSIPNLRFVKINPLFDVGGKQGVGDSISPSEFTSFLKSVAVQWISSGAYRDYPIEPILSYIQVLMGIDSKYCTFNRRKCLNYTTVYPNGLLGICDNFSIKEFPIHVDQEIGFSASLQALSRSSAMTPFQAMRDKCNQCEIQHLCGGGCLSQRHAFRNTSMTLYEDYCTHRKEMFKFMSELVSTQGLA